MDPHPEIVVYSEYNRTELKPLSSLEATITEVGVRLTYISEALKSVDITYIGLFGSLGFGLTLNPKP